MKTWGVLLQSQLNWEDNSDSTWKQWRRSPEAHEAWASPGFQPMRLSLTWFLIEYCGFIVAISVMLSIQHIQIHSHLHLCNSTIQLSLLVGSFYYNIIVQMTRTTHLFFSFPFLCQVQEFLIVVANGSCASNIDQFCALIKMFIVEGIDYERLKLECAMISDSFLAVIHDKEMGIKNNENNDDHWCAERTNNWKFFHQFNRLIGLDLTVLVTIATAKRSFSVINRMQICLQSTMTQNR